MYYKKKNCVEHVALDTTRPGAARLVEIIQDYSDGITVEKVKSSKRVFVSTKRKPVKSGHSLRRVNAKKTGVFAKHKVSRHSCAVMAK